MRVLVLSNMLPDESHPERGRFVRDQVSALEELGVDLELYEFPPGPRALGVAALELKRRYRAQRLDVVHAHFGLTAWPGLAVRASVRGITLHGTDASHPRTRQLTRAVLPLMGLVGCASEALLQSVPGVRARERAQVLPCGVDLERFMAMPRVQARIELGLDPEGPYLLFAADPSRTAKRHDRALQVAGEVPLLTLGGVDPERVALFINAANAVLVPSEREGFGLAVLEALACDVPVLATPVGVHPQALAGVQGALCEPFDRDRWRSALEPHLYDRDPRVEGRRQAELFSSKAMATRIATAWRALLQAGE